MTLLARIRAFVVQDTPPELVACEDCRELHCTHAMAAVCKQRQEVEAKLKETPCL